jgi:hypothetical protein
LGKASTSSSSSSSASTGSYPTSRDSASLSNPTPVQDITPSC